MDGRGETRLGEGPGGRAQGLNRKMWLEEEGREQDRQSRAWG